MKSVLWLALFVLETRAFISHPSTRHYAFASHLKMTAIHYQDWELPDEVPSESLSSSYDLSEYEMSDTRKRRLQHEAFIQNKFVSGDELIHLRQHALSLRQELQQARQLQATRRTHELEQAILQIQQADAEFCYTMNLEKMYMAQAQGREEDYQEYHKLAMEARSALPQYNLDGLWVGKYGDDCYEMINVTYVGDTLIANKVTGHSTVPSGEISFQANLSPFSQQEELEPIELGEEAAQQWECKYLPRFAGTGQVASHGFTNRQVVPGQLIMVKDYFSFAWIPLGHQVFFGRPSAELALKMMQEATPQSRERAHLQRCMEETILLQEEEEEQDDDEEYFYSTNQADYYNQKGCFE